VDAQENMNAESNDANPAAGQLLIYHDGALQLQVRLDGQTAWLTQRGFAELYQVTVPTVNEHLKRIYDEGELSPEATIRKCRIVQIEGTREVARVVEHYSLEAILAVGYRVRSRRGTEFRRWATDRLSELLVKGFTLDDERIAAGQTIGQDYFDELLERIRAIRASERLFYQKITDIYTTSIDYDPNSDSSRTFFAAVQNKLHWAIHGHTAAETIKLRADANAPSMGLTTWKNAPRGPIRRSDVTVAKNYLSSEELTELNRIVSMYLDYAEDQARRHQPMHMAHWEERLDAFLQFNERNVLHHAGSISHELATQHAQGEFERFDRNRLAASSGDDADAVEQLIEGSKRVKRKLVAGDPEKKR